MKKSLLIAAVAALSALTCSADQLSGSGYYRVKNYMTGRYLFVLDNRAKTDVGASTVELHAVELRSGFENCESDPASVLYIKDMGSNQIDIQAQGTGIYDLSGLYIKTRWDSGKKAYYCYGTKEGMTKYLGDAETWTDFEEFFPDDPVFLSDAATGDYRLWVPEKMSLDAGRYFGVQATVSANGEHWAPFFVGFPYSLASAGMEVHSICLVDVENAIAVTRPVEDARVPGKSGVIVKCTSDKPADNKLNVGDGPETTIPDNKLRGVYFNNTNVNHENQTAYNPNTMRVLGVKADGTVGFVKSTQKYLNRNESYLVVPTGSPDEFSIMDEEAYAAVSVDAIGCDAESRPFDVYNLQGVRVAAGVTSFDSLPAGLYVAKGRKVVVH